MMSRVAKMNRVAKQNRQQTTTPWAAMRPRVTTALLAGIAKRIAKHFRPQKVVLFGSYAHGIPDQDSDVDLLVVMDSKESMSQRIRRVTAVAKVPFLPMDIVVRTPAEIEDRLANGDFFIADILSRGKVLYQRDAR